ncbi:hypothetical protein PIB30_021269 [Stylosanthes scabra]|uniref:Uncharacterized protein n=1 Tax=Stylosanthes scabra TaxID=79078 RepID=A0ABU6X7L4_9FABA|nr:hypothetical protein [Stylosanthes scabra]
MVTNVSHSTEPTKPVTNDNDGRPGIITPTVLVASVQKSCVVDVSHKQRHDAKRMTTSKERKVDSQGELTRPVLITNGLEGKTNLGLAQWAGNGTNGLEDLMHNTR